MNTIICDEGAALVNKLPMRLRTTASTEVLMVAQQSGYVTLSNDGHAQWLRGSKTLLAYFCGRMWCGDTPIYSHHAQCYLWRRGPTRFPQKALEAFFAMHNLRTLRKKRLLCRLPEGWEEIENFFRAL